MIGQGITQGVINGGTKISTNLITNVLKKSSKILFNTNMFQLNTLQSEALVIGPQDDSVESKRKIICTSNNSINIRGEHISRIDTPRVKENIWSVIDTTSNVLSCTNNVEKFDTLVHGYTNKERNLESSRIKEVDVKIIFYEIGKEPDSNARVKLPNSVLSESPKLIRLGHPTVETADIRIINFATSTRANNLNRVTEGHGKGL